MPWIRHTVSTYALFYSMCTVDRSMFAINPTLATLSAYGQLMFRDAESVATLFRASIFFWCIVFIQLVFFMIKLGALEKGWVAVIGTAVAQVAVLIAYAIYYIPLTGFFWACLKPAH